MKESKNVFFPFKGIQDISFGMPRDEVRAAISEEYTTFRRNQFSVNSLDYYRDRGFFILYDENDYCNAIEFTDTSNLYFEEKNLFGLSYSQLRVYYDNLSLQKEEEEEVGITYHDLGFGANHAYGTDNIDSIIIFSKGY
jgi:hypothetical protein